MSEEKIVGAVGTVGPKPGVVHGNVIKAPEPGLVVNVLLVPGGKMPTKATPEAAGLDLYVRVPVVITAKNRVRVKVGIKTIIPPGYYFQVHDKSGLAGKGVDRRAGVIDSDFRDEWEVVVVNDTNGDYPVNVGEKIAQAVLLELPAFTLKEVNSVEYEANSSNRGGGFGSTGK